MAHRDGRRVRGITLWFFGGVAELDGDAAGPGAEFRTAVVGPACSLLIAGVLAGIDAALAAAGTGRLLVVAVGWLAGINALLGVFNLLPAFPLDGGRVLRAALWRACGDRRRATVWAARGGRALGGALALLGLAGALAFGWGLSGLWLAVVGMFITAAAGQQLRTVQTEVALAGITAGDLVGGPPASAPAHLSVAELVEQWMRPRRLACCPLVDGTGMLVGVVGVAGLRALPAPAWPLTSARRVAVPMTEVVTCQRGAPLAEVATRLTGATLGTALVFDGARLVGLLDAGDVRRAAMWAQLTAGGRGAAAGRPPMSGQPVGPRAS